MDREKNAAERAFYDLTGEVNAYDYITTEGKRTGRQTALDYLQKNTGVFNDKGMLSVEEVNAMKERAKKNEGHLFHGFISLNEIDSPKIDTPEKCIELVKRTFPKFFQEAKFQKDNVDLMCALHLDRPHHLHIHFLFWEKEPKYKDEKGNLYYRRKGKIDKAAIDNMFIRIGEFLDEDKDRLYMSRDEGIKKLKKVNNFELLKKAEIKKELLALAKDLPKTGRITYGSKDMEPYRARVDNIVKLMLETSRQAKKFDRKFYKALAERERLISNICGEKTFVFTDKKVSTAQLEKDYPKYHEQIDKERIEAMITALEFDYKRRQGNLVLNLAKYIKENYKENYGKHKANDTALKRSLGISRNKITKAVRKFYKTFGSSDKLFERDFNNRLQEIEEEIERERERNNTKKKREEDYKN